jgi:predicted O-methyltransferase YrrM
VTLQTASAMRSIKDLIKQHVPRSSINRALLTFPQLYGALRYESQLNPEQLEILQSIVGENRPGNIIECGVYRAGTTVLLARLLKQRRLAKKIYALDSFSGFAEEIEEDVSRGQVVEEGRAAFTANSVDYVQRKLAVLGVADVIEVVPGYFEDTLPGIEDRFCLALIDCDLEKSVEFCLEHLWERIVPGGWMVVDDYSNPGYPGAAVAADRFFHHVSYRSRMVSNNFLLVQR